MVVTNNTHYSKLYLDVGNFSVDDKEIKSLVQGILVEFGGYIISEYEAAYVYEIHFYTLDCMFLVKNNGYDVYLEGLSSNSIGKKRVLDFVSSILDLYDD